MRFLHTADWHLGRQLHGVSLLEDQAHALGLLVDVARESRVEAVVVAGDVYDRAVPGADAVALLDDVLEELVLGLGVPVLMIAGNHDSPQRLEFGSRLLGRQGLHVTGLLPAEPSPVVLGGDAGPVSFFLVPYADPATVRQVTGNGGLHSHDEALGEITAAIRRRLEPGRPSVVVAHGWVAGGTASESERPLTVGGSGEVAAERFAGFDYVALGHLHRPQRLGERLAYSGSLLKYSFSEADHAKSAAVVELGDGGPPRLERVPLPPKRDLRILQGRLADLLSGPAPGASRDDYLLVRLDDTDALLDAMGKLRRVYPNVLHLERPGLERRGELALEGRERLRRGDMDLFASFFEQTTGEPLDHRQREALGKVLEALHRRQREEPEAAP